MKNRFNELLLSTHREGMEDLIAYMELNGFYTAPCSTKFHLSCEKGLLMHSINVYNKMVSFYNSQTEFTTDQHSIAIVSLLHDIGKCEQYVPNILKSGQQSTSTPYETNKDLHLINHETRSLIIASQFIKLTNDEQYAILYHNNQYTPTGYTIKGKETPLMLLLYYADLWCSRVTEKEML